MSRAAVMEPMQFKYKRADDCNKWTQSTCQESPSKRPMKSQFSLPATRSIESPTNLRLAHAENLKRPLMLRAPGRAPVPLLLLLALALPQSLSSAPSRSQSCDQAKFVASTGFNTTLTVPLGGEAHFRCTVQDKGNCNIAWFHNTRRHHIAIDDQVVTSRRGRVKASHSFNTTFNLYINKVELEDEGKYSCQLNTEPPQFYWHTLNVVMRPVIVLGNSTIKLKPVKEFEPVELRCVAEGVPRPVITWVRESQTFELPPFDGQELDNELNDEGAKRNGTTGSSQTGDRGQRLARSPKLNSTTTTTTTTTTTGVQWSTLESYGLAMSRHQPSMQSAPRLATQMASERLKLLRKERGADLSPVEPNDAGSAAASSNGALGKSRPVLAEGEVFRIERVSRHDMGYYVCIASNSVGKAGQKIFLPVSYAQAPRVTPKATPSGSSSRRPAPADDEARPSYNAVDQAAESGAELSPGKSRTNHVAPTPSVGSGKSYHRYRQYKLARSSSVSSSAHQPSAINLCTTLTLLALVCSWLVAFHSGR